MPQFNSKISTQSEGYAQNQADMLELVRNLREYEARAEALSERRRPRFEERGQLTPRERLARLLDPGMPFLELYNMANFLVDDPSRDTSIPGGSSLVGIGFISGVRCMVMVDDSGINAGAVTTMSVGIGLGGAENSAAPETAVCAPGGKRWRKPDAVQS